MKFKNYRRWHLLLAGWALLLVVASCSKNKDNPAPGPSQSILQIVAGGSNFTLLKEAVIHAGLDGTLGGSGTFTVFAPTDDAFRAAGFPDAAAIDAAPAATVAAILEHHVIGRVYKVADIPVADSTPIATLLNTSSGPDSVFVTKTSAGVVTVDGIQVTTADVLATNGVVHVIGSVLPVYTKRSQSILDIVASNPNFTFLKVAAIKANLTGALGNPGTLTVFAPTDAAFKAAGFADTNAVKALSSSALAGILTHHVLGARFKAADLPTAHNTPVATLANTTAKPDSLYVTKTGAGAVYVDGIKVTTADVTASNGVIHIIGSVLIPPVGTITDYVVARAGALTPEFTLLKEAVLHANLADALAGKGPLTVFAPTDAAFAAAGFATKASIDAAPAATIAGILKLHVIAARVFSSDLVAGMVPTLNGESVTIALTPSPTVKGPGNTAAANIIVTDIATTNGVIHAIDHVLLPN